VSLCNCIHEQLVVLKRERERARDRERATAKTGLDCTDEEVVRKCTHR